MTIQMIKNNIKYLNKKYKDLGVSFKLSGLKIQAYGNTYEEKTKLKKLNFYWNPNQKVWEASADNFKDIDLANTFTGITQPIKDTKNLIYKHIKKVTDPFLNKILKKILIVGEYKNSFFIAPGAKSYHHAYEGGLAEHTLQVLKGALKMYKIYPYLGLNREMLITSAILHDIGKVNCYTSTTKGIEITKYLRDFDHIVLGITIISRIAEDLIENSNDEKKFEHLIQIITSHHNLKEWGSPKEPKSHEAWIIHTMDQLSSKIGGGLKLKNGSQQKQSSLTQMHLKIG